MNKNIFLVTIFSSILFSCGTEKSADEKANTKTDSTVVFAPIEKTTENAPIKDGVYEERHPNGVIKMRGEYAAGKRHGPWLSFYPDGKIWSEGNYKNGIRDGIARTFYPNGNKKYEGFYTNGKESGKWQFWDEEGKPVKEVDYDKK